MMGPERGGETSWTKRLTRGINEPAKQKSVDVAEIQMRVWMREWLLVEDFEHPGHHRNREQRTGGRRWVRSGKMKTAAHLVLWFLGACCDYLLEDRFDF
jgi:hypothetical protein